MEDKNIENEELISALASSESTQDEASEDEATVEKVEEKQDDLTSLIAANSSEVTEDVAIEDEKQDKKKKKAKKVVEEEEFDNGKIFKKFKIKDFVFLAIMAGCMLITSAVMPLVINVPIFGIIQMALGIQCSLFPVIGLMKVRKPGSLLIMCACFGVFIVFIQPIMGAGVLVCALLAEALTLLFFRGYKSDWACIFEGTIFFPLSLPGLYLYYHFIFKGEAGAAVQAMINPSPGVAVGISFAVLAITFVGALIGAIIAKELKKAGVLKK